MKWINNNEMYLAQIIKKIVIVIDKSIMRKYN